MSNPKCHKVLFDGLNSDKDRLGSNEHWTETAIYGVAKSTAEKRREIKYEVIVVIFFLALSVLFAKVVSEAKAEERFQQEITR